LAILALIGVTSFAEAAEEMDPYVHDAPAWHNNVHGPPYWDNILVGYNPEVGYVSDAPAGSFLNQVEDY
jgi:hypothetical protein